MKPFGRRTTDIQISGIRRFTELVSQYPGARTLTIGQPHFGTPNHIKEAAQQAIEAGHIGYTPNRGMPSLRKAAYDYYGKRIELDYHPEKEILVTVGATQAIDITLRVLLEPDDEVIIPGPAYPGYEPLVHMANAKAIIVDTRDDDLKLTPARLKAALTPKTKLLILSSPANPTGAVYAEGELSALAVVIEEADLYVVSDEIYTELYYDTQPTSIAKQPGMKDRTVVIQGVSKSHCMTGWRIGFVLASEVLVNEMVKVLQYSTTCASSISQYAALEALTSGVDDAQVMRDAYRLNRDVVMDTLHAQGIPIVKPEGAFYAFPSIREFGMPSLQFATRLLAEAGVAMIPGDAFGPSGEGHVRLSFACHPNDLQAALASFGEFVHKLRNTSL